MSKIVNLRTIRKQKDRDRKRSEGDASAARHGEAPALREAREAEAARAARALEGHRTDGND